MAIIPVQVTHNNQTLEAKDVKIQIKNGEEVMVDTDLQSMVHKLFAVIEQNIQMAQILEHLAEQQEKAKSNIVVANEQQLKSIDGRKQK